MLENVMTINNEDLKDQFSVSFRTHIDGTFSQFVGQQLVVQQLVVQQFVPHCWPSNWKDLHTVLPVTMSRYRCAWCMVWKMFLTPIFHAVIQNQNLSNSIPIEKIHRKINVLVLKTFNKTVAPTRLSMCLYMMYMDVRIFAWFSPHDVTTVYSWCVFTVW